MYALKIIKLKNGVDGLRENLKKIGYKEIDLFHYVKGDSNITITIKRNK